MTLIERVWAAIRDAQPAEPVSGSVAIEWKRDPDGSVIEVTEDLIKREDETWSPPPPARVDRWRPRSTLDHR